MTDASDPRTPGRWLAARHKTASGTPAWKISLTHGNSILVFADEVDGLMDLLAGLKVDAAVAELSEVDEILPSNVTPIRSSTKDAP